MNCPDLQVPRPGEGRDPEDGALDVEAPACAGARKKNALNAPPPTATDSSMNRSSRDHHSALVGRASALLRGGSAGLKPGLRVPYSPRAGAGPDPEGGALNIGAPAFAGARVSLLSVNAPPPPPPTRR